MERRASGDAAENSLLVRLIYDYEFTPEFIVFSGARDMCYTQQFLLSRVFLISDSK